VQTSSYLLFGAAAFTTLRSGSVNIAPEKETNKRANELSTDRQD
jgi:hypothetical protein